MNNSLTDEINELKQVRILADKCEIPLDDIKKNIDKRIKIFENLEKPKERIKRKGNGKQITKLQLARKRNKELKENNIIKKW